MTTHKDPMGLAGDFDDDAARERLQRRPGLVPGGPRPYLQVIDAVDEGDGCTPRGAADDLCAGWVPFHLTVIDEHPMPYGTSAITTGIFGEMTAQSFLMALAKMAALQQAEAAEPVPGDPSKDRAAHTPTYDCWGVMPDGRLLLVGLADEAGRGRVVFEEWSWKGVTRA